MTRYFHINTKRGVIVTRRYKEDIEPVRERVRQATMFPDCSVLEGERCVRKDGTIRLSVHRIRMTIAHKLEGPF